jgi:hypothetical protein
MSITNDISIFSSIMERNDAPKHHNDRYTISNKYEYIRFKTSHIKGFKISGSQHLTYIVHKHL